MPFIHVARTIDDLLYEILTWLIFFPVTLWRSILHPLGTMDYALAELASSDAAAFRETLRPPIFLLVSVIVAYVVELAAVGESPVVSSRIGLANLINDDESMMIFRIVGFALFPLLMAAIESGLAHRPVNRDTLRQPFYAQCFLAAPFVLALSLAITAIRRPEAWMEPVAFGAALVASALYVVAEATWLVRATKRSWMLAAPSALAGYIACMLILGIASALLGGE